MVNEYPTICKLMILYMLDKVSLMYLTNTQISAFFLEYNYASYIEFQDAITDLIEAKLIESYKSKTLTRYKLTQEGKSTIDFFPDDLTPGAKKDIEEYISKNKIKFRKESSTMADITESENGNYKVKLEIEESKESTFSIEMLVPDAELATKIVEKWKNEDKVAQNIYEYIIKQIF